MGMPRYENIDQLPNIAMAVKNHIEYIIMQTQIPIIDTEALEELQIIIDYLVYLLNLYQLQMLPTGFRYLDISNEIIITTPSIIGSTL